MAIQIDIYGIGVIISAIAGIVFTIRNEEKRALISFMILLAIMLLKYMLT